MSIWGIIRYTGADEIPTISLLNKAPIQEEPIDLRAMAQQYLRHDSTYSGILIVTRDGHCHTFS